MNDKVVTGSIESRSDYKKTPRGQYKYWNQEIASSEKNLRDFRKEGGKIVERYTGGKRKSIDTPSSGGRFRLNLFHSNTITLQSMLYGSLPKVDVARRHNDPNDDIGRVAAEIMGRLLNSDLKEASDSYNSVLKAVLQDRLLPGLGCARVRYDYDPETQTESAPVEYYHWRDVCWGWARTFSEVPWIAFRSYLSKDEIKERFGEEAAEGVELEQQSTTGDKEEDSEAQTDGPWLKAQVWEVWDKTKREVVWFSKGYDKVLETKKDFLNLAEFYPCPPFLLANPTTTMYTPTSDYYLAQDLYNEIDTLQTRISIITEAVKVVGVYNQAAGQSLGRVFKEGTDNDLIPVDNWALFGENGGIAGQVDWVPMEDIVNTLAKLRELRDEQIGLLQQVTGMSDIMRGELGGQYEGVGQSQLKAKFGSVRVQALQDEFAQFASSLMAIKAEIVGKHYEPELIAKLANTMSFMEADRELIPQAIALLKQPELSKLHIEIKSESMALVDYAQLKAERTEYLTAVSTFIRSASPLMEAEPQTAPFVLQLLQWGLSGLKGGNQIEGVIDKAIQTATEAAKKPKPQDDSAAKAEQAKMQLEQMKHNLNMQEAQAKTQAELAKIQAKAQADAQTRQVDHQADVAKIKAELQADLQEIAAKMQADIKTEAITSQINAEQAIAAQQGEIQKKAVETAIDIQASKEKPTNEQRQ